MKAMVHTNYGRQEVLRLTQIDQPEPKDKELLIRARATTVTAVDYWMRGFKPSPAYRPFARLQFGIFGPRQTVPRIELAGEGAP